MYRVIARNGVTKQSFSFFVIPAKAGIQKEKGWISHQVRNDRNRRGIASLTLAMTGVTGVIARNGVTKQSFSFFVIPAKAGIQKGKGWIPHQVRNDRNRRGIASLSLAMTGDKKGVIDV